MQKEFDTKYLFERLEQGDSRAEHEIFERYFPRLIGLARARLSEQLAQKVDPDDIVQSALRSFYVRAEDGQYSIRRAGDLWKLLATITHTKLLKQAEHFRQKKRSLKREQGGAEGHNDNTLPDVAPSNADAIELAEELQRLLRCLQPADRTILELRLSGRPIPEIAEHIKRSERTVRRSLKATREVLEERLQGVS